MDKDKNGVLTMDEIKEASNVMSNLNFKGKWDQIFQQVDLDGDGQVDFQEFFAAAVNHQKLLTKKNLEYLFKTLDQNDDGFIDVHEFKHALPTSHRDTLQNIEGQGSSSQQNHSAS